LFETHFENNSEPGISGRGALPSTLYGVRHEEIASAFPSSPGCPRTFKSGREALPSLLGQGGTVFMTCFQVLKE
jgi:hypothetical protein